MTSFQRILSALAAVAVVATVLSTTALAQGGQDFSQVQITTTQLAPSYYTLAGAGGTIGVLVGPDGVFMVDSQYAPLTEKIVAAVKGGSIRDVATVNDSSDRKAEIRIEVELKKGANADVVINQLYQYTPLQSNINVMNVALVDRQPAEGAECPGTSASC